MPLIQGKIQVRAPVDLVCQWLTHADSLLSWAHPLLGMAQPSSTEGAGPLRVQVRVLGVVLEGVAELAEQSPCRVVVRFRPDAFAEWLTWTCEAYRRGASTIVEVQGEYIYNPFAGFIPDRLTCHALLVQHLKLCLETLRILVESQRDLRSLQQRQV